MACGYSLLKNDGFDATIRRTIGGGTFVLGTFMLSPNPLKNLWSVGGSEGTDILLAFNSFATGGLLAAGRSLFASPFLGLKYFVRHGVGGGMLVLGTHLWSPAWLKRGWAGSIDELETNDLGHGMYMFATGVIMSCGWSLLLGSETNIKHILLRMLGAGMFALGAFLWAPTWARQLWIF